MKKIIAVLMAFSLAGMGLAFAGPYDPTEFHKEYLSDDSPAPESCLVDSEYVWIKGSSLSKKESIGIRKAELDARANAANARNSYVKQMESYYANEAGTEDDQQLLDAYESLVISKSEAYFRNMTRVSWTKRWDDRQKAYKYYVLMRIPLEDWKDALRNDLAEANAKLAESGKFRKSQGAEEANARMEKAMDRWFGEIEAAERADGKGDSDRDGDSIPDRIRSWFSK